ncbi:hypothetical protein nbrc107696_24690 [Gordonia spumicola]|uniref:Transcriptional regulator n=1 Tax=Gordonia spumicola TaxID=589161 RepID=A0A7I9VAB9_9ACTN|nr:helix-turn-helix domain-containing protein [Gordonia spumicola]GEE02023.1 hypothetical protein nbrc107696_24690 [Gordonia spumicola]
MRPSPEVADLIRTGVQIVLDAPAEWLKQVDSAVLGGAGMDVITSDPTLLEVALRINEGNLRHWATANAADPGARVPVNVGAEAETYIRDLARRGLDAGSLDSFRTAQNVAWHLWMEICFALTDDPVVLRELLQVTSASIATFVDDTVKRLAELIDAARAELAGDTHAQRRVAVALVLEGAPISRERAESQLRYRLDGPHTAVILSGDTGIAHDELEVACEALMEASEVTRRLTVVAGAAELWVWLPTATVATDAALERHPGIRMAVGSSGVDLDGFRRSHFEALSVRGVIARVGSSRRIAHFDDLRLVTLLGEDPSAADEFVETTLGDLRNADDHVLTCVRTWFASGCNAAETAVKLYTHRNTVVRRLARADALLPVPLSVNALHVAVALDLLEWRT